MGRRLEEDNEFLNQIDMGYVGITKPKTERHIDTTPRWVIKKRQEAAKQFNIPPEEVADEPDEGPESSSEAWA